MKKNKIPDLVFPDPDAKIPNSHFEVKKLEPKDLVIEDIRTGLNLAGLVINLVCLFAVLFVTYHLLGRKFDSNIIRLGIPSIGIWMLFVNLQVKLWTTVDGRTAKVFLDPVRKVLFVFHQGFYFLPWYFRQEKDTVSFFKHEIIERSKGKDNRPVMPTQDGYNFTAELRTLFKRGESRDALRKSLRYTMEDLTGWIESVVLARLSDLVACNSYSALLHHKTLVIKWVADIFGGEQNLSVFEIDTGTEIKDPLLEAFEPTTESRQLYSTRGRIDIIADGIKRLKDLGVGPEEASIIGQVAEGSAERIVRTYQGIPKDARVVALGDNAIAVAGKGGGK